MRDLWQSEILRHFRAPEGRAVEGTTGAEGFARNRRCGDEVHWLVELGEGGRIRSARHRVAGCAITTATASLMVPVMEGLSPGEARARLLQLFGMLQGGAGEDLPESWDPLRMVGPMPARHSCVRVVAEGLEKALQAAEAAFHG